MAKLLFSLALMAALATVTVTSVGCASSGGGGSHAGHSH